MIEMTKNAVEGKNNIWVLILQFWFLEIYKKGEHGAPADARVIYGDTDSVMVEFGCQDIAEAMKLGQHAADLISQRFPSPIKLEFEKVGTPR